MNTGIWINIVKQPLNGPFHSDLKSFIVSSLSFCGSSAYFFCNSSTFGWILLIHCVILLDAADDLYINHLTSNVNATIATQSCHPEIAKNIKAMWEETKWNIRKIRQDAMNDTKKFFTAKEISEDEHNANESNIDDLTKKMNTKIDDLVKAKSEEVLKI